MNASKDPLNERDFELINIVGGQLASNQRDLSRYMNLSLGMTNMLLKRLVTKGYIRIKQLDRRKVEYFLTPKGFAEKMRKSVKYTLKTISSIGLIKKQLLDILGNLYAKGHRKFYVLGDSDFAQLVESALIQSQWGGVEVGRVKSLSENPDGLVLICREDENSPELSGERYVDLIKELASRENNEFEAVER
ncbi:MAG: winged helix DNA-binding protein [Candidatus Omnitrophica bacterium]|nr:winged helix DNA-binding protein [Candidatus Omnitrophota bacterium]